jgi:hypothetical protein
LSASTNTGLVDASATREADETIIVPLNESTLCEEEVMEDPPVVFDQYKTPVSNDYTLNVAHKAMARLRYAGLQEAAKIATTYDVVVCVGGDPTREFFGSRRTVYINPVYDD